MKQVVLIGDSIRMGYEPFVREMLGREAEVWAPADNCSSSRYLMDHLDEWVISRQPDIVHLNCGLHDLAYKDADGRPSGQRLVPLDEYKDNVRAILTTIRGQTPALVMWASSTPVNERWHIAKKDFPRYEADVDAYNDAGLAAARSLGIPVNDLNRVIAEGGRDNLLSEDGVHFKDAGYRVLAEAVVKMLRPMLAVSG
jgi:isoamyl acetate esterase